MGVRKGKKRAGRERHTLLCRCYLGSFIVRKRAGSSNLVQLPVHYSGLASQELVSQELTFTLALSKIVSPRNPVHGLISHDMIDRVPSVCFVMEWDQLWGLLIPSGNFTKSKWIKLILS
jgi:hypothetical protein